MVVSMMSQVVFRERALVDQLGPLEFESSLIISIGMFFFIEALSVCLCSRSFAGNQSDSTEKRN
jgi:hypothetical protein